MPRFQLWLAQEARSDGVRPIAFGRRDRYRVERLPADLPITLVVKTDFGPDDAYLDVVQIVITIDGPTGQNWRFEPSLHGASGQNWFDGVIDGRLAQAEKAGRYRVAVEWPPGREVATGSFVVERQSSVRR